MLYGLGLPQKLIGGWTDEVGLGSYEGNEVSLSVTSAHAVCLSSPEEAA